MEKTTKFDWITLGLKTSSILIFMFMYLPMLVVVVYSFNGNAINSFPITHWSLKWYSVLFQDLALLHSLLNSVYVAVAGTIIGLLLGIPAAFAIDRFQFPGKVFFERIVLLPMILPGIITGVAMMSAFVLLGMNLSLITIFLGHGTFLIAVVMTQVYARLKRMDRSIEEASLDLGAKRIQTFFLVVLPNLKTAIISASLLSFTLSLDEIPVTYFLTGRELTLPVQFWAMLRRGITPEVNAISTLIFVFSVIMIVLVTRLNREET
ncbi:ABC transporter permease [Bacillus sp. ISL-4]|uniref:ABC transporter permease n=1 Tax=Bacillus sp. ISL-4 TaxID=2819125 RepID=UPI001BE9258E|nr:ABC transporter permease [Bacillus sp. ISL-4]MBT2667849.1 ABC transporter permease [Bacillus sp. ISL-4]MBT2674581.1 ABC transporter permease [Streptomyces sp. ISL-14]